MTFLNEQDKVRAFYGELQGYLEQAPNDDNAAFYDKAMWKQVNTAIDLLNQATGKDYSRFKISPSTSSKFVCVRVYAYKAKLGSLIMTLYREYFSDYEDPPSFSKNSSTIIHNQNSQHQSQQQQQEQKIELEQMLRIAQEMIQAEYGEQQAKKASDLIKQIVMNPKNWSIIAASVTGLLAIGKVAFIAALPILGKILLETAPVHSA